MKKYIFHAIIISLMIFYLTGCGNKTAIITDDFKAITEKMNYTNVDAKDQFDSYEYIKEVTIAESQDGFQVEFYVLDNEINATSMFNTNKSTFESYKGSSSFEFSSSVGNYSSYSLTSNGYYMYVCRVDNTLLYVKVQDTYKDSVKNLIKELGY